MEFAFKNAYVYKNQKVTFNPEYTCQVGIQGDVAISSFLKDELSSSVSEYGIFPGFCDVHVHLREPGFSYKETIKSGTMASARGGYTDVLSMPNLNPVPHNEENMNVQLDLIKKDAVIGVHPFASLTIDEKGEKLSDIEKLAPISIGYSDDGRGVQSESLMRSAMEKAKALNKIISAHCEDNSLLNGGYIHKGEYALKNNHLGICSESEWGPIKRDIKLAKETGCKYHVCHISTKESVELIRQAKKDGVDITKMFRKLPARYFGTLGEAGAVTSDGLTMRSLVEQDVTLTGNYIFKGQTLTSGTKFHLFAGDIIPEGITLATEGGVQVPYYTEDSSIVLKIVHKSAVPYMSGFEAGTSFFNPRSLTENQYLTFAHNTIEALHDKPFITVKAEVSEI